MRTIHISLFAVMSTLAVGLSDCSCNKPATGGEGEAGEGEGATAGEGEGATAGEGEGATAGEGEGATAGEGEGEGTGCTTDTDCNAGQVCLASSHTCGALPCTNNAQCGTGQVCDATTQSCVAAACTVATQATDCGAGKICDSTTLTCVGAPCTSNTDCGGNLVCFADGTCGNSPVTDPYQAFCLGSGSVVGGAGIGSSNICGGQLAQQTFNFGLCTCGDFTDTGSSNLNLDSFNSNTGPYGGTNIGSDGNAGFDGQMTGNVKPQINGDLIVGQGNISLPQGTTKVTGDLYVLGNADSGNTTVGRDAFIGGTIGSGFHIVGTLFSDQTSDDNATAATKTVLAIPPVTPCPCDPSQEIDIAGIVAFGQTNNDNAVVADPNATPPVPALDPNLWAGPANGPSTLTLPCGRFFLNGVTQTQGLTIHATARTVLFINGPFDADSLTVQLDDGAEVDLFVTGDMTFGSATAVGDVTHPSAVRTYVLGQLNSKASTTFGGLVYAPNANVTFSGHVQIFGAVFLNNLSTGGDIDIHFDSAVRTAGQECPVAGEGEGEGEGASAGEGEGASAGEGEGATAGEGEGATAGEGEGATAGEGEGASAGEGEGEGATSQCQQCDPTNACGGEACIITNGVGTCGPCRTALDCCFPEICSSTGQCIFAGG